MTSPSQGHGIFFFFNPWTVLLFFSLLVTELGGHSIHSQGAWKGKLRPTCLVLRCHGAGVGWGGGGGVLLPGPASQWAQTTHDHWPTYITRAVEQNSDPAIEILLYDTP